MRPEAVAAMLPYLTDAFANPSGGHAAARASKTALEEARETIAWGLGAAPGEIVFTGGGTEADNLAIEGAARAARARGGGLGVVTCAFEHKAVLAACDRLASEGFHITRIPATSGGLVDLDALADAVDAETAVVSLMTVNNEVGTVQPLAEAGSIVREQASGAVLHTDAVQAVPWIDVASATAPAALVAISAHKFGGPKGTGALVVRDDIVLQPLLEGGGQERGLRAGTVNVAGAVAMAAALRVTIEQRDDEIARITTLRDRLLDGLEGAIPGLAVNGDRAHKVAGSLHVRIPGVEADTLLVALDRAGVCAAAGSSCSSGATEPSYVLAAMGMDRGDALSSIRLSLGFASTPADVDAALAVIPEVVRGVRARSAA